MPSAACVFLRPSDAPQDSDSFTYRPRTREVRDTWLLTNYRHAVVSLRWISTGREAAEECVGRMRQAARCRSLRVSSTR